MDPITARLRANGNIMRRRDLLAAGFSDRQIRAALAAHRIFRVRHGWYALPTIADPVARVLRVGGRITGLAALKHLGLYLPQPTVIDIAVPRGAAGLRDPYNRRVRLGSRSGIRINWIDPPRRERAASDWMASEDDALLCVLRRESRETAVAACDAVLRYRHWSTARLAKVFARAPGRVQCWQRDVDGRADAWGETVLRVRVRDAGLPFEPQYVIPGVGRLDGRIKSGLYVEVNGKQHDEAWTGDGPSSFESDHERALLVALDGGRIISVTYRQLEDSWPLILSVIRKLAAE